MYAFKCYNNVNMVLFIAVMVDMTDPLAGWVTDGSSRDEDLDFSSSAASIVAKWGDFVDPESGISAYEASVFVNGQRKETFSFDGSIEELEDHTQHFEQGDHIHVIKF